jgi:ATP-dependent RNA helicase DDX23/PRP28
MDYALINRDHFGNLKRHKPNATAASAAAAAANPVLNKLVVLGMDDDEQITLDTTTKTGSSTYNLITNSLGHNKAERQQHLESSSSRQIDTSLLPRNRELRNADLRPWQEKTLDEMTQRDWTILREEFQMLTRGTNIPNPLRFWDDLNIYQVPNDLMDAIHAMGYQHPTGIQRIAMPTALLNRDLIARAQTGSGKTCSFLVPVITYISKQPGLDERSCMDGPYGVILAPARELATQIYDEAIKLTKFMTNTVNVACIIGGKKEYSLKDRIELIVATPGRLDDLLEQRELVLNQCRYIILDEADKMLDEGFEPQVNRILAAMPSANNNQQQQQQQNQMNDSHSMMMKLGAGFSNRNNHQNNQNNPNNYNNNNNQNNLITNLYQDKRRRTMLYSATFSSKIEELARRYMQPDFVKVEVGDQTHKINKSVEQIIEWLPPNEDAKVNLLCKYINQYPQSKVIIFCARKENCDNLCYRLGQISRHSQSHQNRGGGGGGGFRGGAYLTHPVNPIVLHSDASDREANLRGFKEGDFNVLIATDVAGRGIDVKEVKLVVNYELPDIKVVITDQNKCNPNIYNSIFEAYTHRVGRTGRAGQTGTAVTFITDKERGLIPLFRNFLVKNGVKNFPKQFLHLADSEGDNRPITN